MKEHFITADLCNKYDLDDKTIAEILINSFPNGETKSEEETFVRNQFLACLTTSRPSNWPAANKPFTTHTIHINKEKGKALYQKCQGALEEAGFNVTFSKERGTMEVKWDKPNVKEISSTNFKYYYTFYSGQDEEQIKPQSDRERISTFLGKWENNLKDIETGENVEINAVEEFPEDPYKPVETLMAFLLSKGYKANIDYFSNPPKISVAKGKEEKQMETDDIMPNK